MFATIISQIRPFGALAAKQLGAEAVIIGWSGMGVYRDLDGGSQHLMPELYLRTLSEKNEKWNFKEYIPRAVVVNLGTNDFAGTKNLITSEFVDTYIGLANNPQTRGMLSGKLFSSMKPYATFINTGRGAQVSESDLISVLKARPDLTAVLDVTDPEPPLPESEFYNLDNCILTPHIAGSSGTEVHRMAEYMYAEFEIFVQNKPCRFEVTLKLLETMA